LDEQGKEKKFSVMENLGPSNRIGRLPVAGASVNRRTPTHVTAQPALFSASGQPAWFRFPSFPPVEDLFDPPLHLAPRQLPIIIPRE